MKSNLLAKLIIAVCLCVVVALAFTACKDKEIFAESSDFESYPEYWNDFNDNTTGDIYVPDSNNDAVTDNTSGDSTVSNSSSDGSDSNNNVSNNETGDSDTSSDDFTANFEDEDENTTSSEVDTDKDNIPDDKDPDDDNDGITDDKDPDDDNDGIKDEDEANYGNQGPLLLF